MRREERTFVELTHKQSKKLKMSKVILSLKTDLNKAEVNIKAIKKSQNQLPKDQTDKGQEPMLTSVKVIYSFF